MTRQTPLPERAVMPDPDFEGARQYALKRLQRELAPVLRYHSLAHTRDDVAVAAERLAALEGLGAADRLLLCTAAYFHDIGYITERANHEAAGIRIVKRVLPRYGYSAAQVDTVSRLLLATQLPQTPASHAEMIMADADLDVLGREDYWARSHDLRAEWEYFGLQVTDEEWHRSQLDFLLGHRYFTAAAIRLREATKQANIARLRRLLKGDVRARDS
jgi:uncharacterized protein